MSGLSSVVSMVDEIEQTALALLSSLEGVHHAGVLPEELRNKLIAEEERYTSIGPIAVDNLGVKEAATRERLFVIIKDRKFRPPPTPTVLLVDGDGEVLGEEILPGQEKEPEEGERLIYLGSGFAIYSSRAKGRGRDSRFVLPPVPFPEVERLDFARNVISASPSTLGDLEIKKALGLPDDPRLASILVGFDVSRDE